KTREQKARESEKLLEVEKVLATERKKSGVKADLVPTLAQGSEENKKGKSRDIAAETVGFKSGQELERSLLAVKKIDELTAQGRTDDAQLIRNELNNGSASAAEKLAKGIGELSDKDKQDIFQKKVSVNKATSKGVKKAVEKVKPNVVKAVGEKIKYPKTADDPDGLGLITPEKVDNYGFSIDGSADIEAILYADPRKLADFMQTVKYICDWASYTAIDNEENLKIFANKAISDARREDNKGEEYVMLRSLIDNLEKLIDTIKPIVENYESEIHEKNRQNEEHRKQQDEIAAQKRREAAEEQRHRSMEQSRQYSQNVQEAKRKSEAAKQEENREVDW
ncbi:MAG: hypothetical protein NC299_16755, partial [Lachnospiraceae bacterium]|nr:hypothetical protein [Lachnospiraceae bacterium]